MTPDSLQTWKDLGVVTGTPRFPDPLYVNKPNAVNRARFIELMDAMFASRWFSDAELVRDFERQIARLTGVRHCVATCNGTQALQLMYRALGLAGEVIVPSFTFIATIQALRCINATPVYCDVHRDTHNMNAAQVERLITPRTSAIVGVHLWGQSCDVDALTEVAHRHSLPLIFDAAHAFGSSYRGRPVGSFGAAEAFSFHATKFINTGEGGAVTTNDDALAGRLRAVRRFGFQGEEVLDGGTNAKMPEICAALGLTYLESFDELIAANHAVYSLYRSQLSELPGISLLAPDQLGKSNYQYVVVSIDELAAGLSRDELLRILTADNILARRYFFPGCHRLIPGAYPLAPSALPVTEDLLSTVLVLPGGASIGAQEVHRVCQTLRLAVSSSVEVRAALADHQLMAAG